MSKNNSNRRINKGEHMFEYRYKGNIFMIEVCVGDWGKYAGWFHVINDQPFDFGYTQTLDEMKKVIRTKYDKYMNNIPKNEEEWVKLVESCIIIDGYEDWHVDKRLAMRTLNLYAKYKNKNIGEYNV